MIKVGDIMTSDFISVAPTTPVVEVARKMKEWRTGVITVCEGKKLWGVITERDVVIAIARPSSDPKRKHAASLANKHHPTISPDEELTQAARVMINHGVRVLPVTQEGELLGIFTLDNLAQESMALAAVIFARTVKPPVTSGSRSGELYLKVKSR